METELERPARWRPVTTDDVPMHAVVRFHDRGLLVEGTAVDVLDGNGRPLLVVRAEDGQHHVAPESCALEMQEG